MRSFLVVGLVLVASLRGAEAGELEIDSASFLHLPQAGSVHSVPTGKLPIVVSRVPDGTIGLRISQGFSIQPDVAPGARLAVEMSGDATGTCNPSGRAYECTLSMPLVVRQGDAAPQRVTLRFTTGTATAVAGHSRSGVPLDPANGAISMVAGGTIASQGDPLHGHPYLVVLSATLTDDLLEAGPPRD